MKKKQKKDLFKRKLHQFEVEAVVVLGLTFIAWAVFRVFPITRPLSPMQGPLLPAMIPVEKPAAPQIPVLPPPPPKPTGPSFPFTTSSTRIISGIASITASSSPIFAYAHGTAFAGGKFLIGMSNRSGNPFPSDQLVVFTDPENLSHSVTLPLPAGDIQTMVRDPISGNVYFALTGNHDLQIYGINPYSLRMFSIISTSTIDLGAKPAIVTDGTYVYGITNTDPSTVFKVKIRDGSLTYSSFGHIKYGHSAAIGIYGSSTELYFGGGMSNGFEKADASSLQSMGSLDFKACLMSDDSPFIKTSDQGGYVYVGCEVTPYGYRVSTSDLSVTRFPLPGSSLGLFIFGNDLYNTGQDGNLDVFPGMNLDELHRYYLPPSSMPELPHGQSIEFNELFMPPQSGSIYFTAWWGIPGLYRLATSSEVL